MEKIGYYLVLEKRLGDYNLIDINKLDICNAVIVNDIAAIDSFTCKFTESELKASIERSNMVQPEYLDGQLKIISDVKHNLRVLTIDVFNGIIEFQNNNEIIDQNYKNKLFGSYKKVVESSFKDTGFIQKMLARFKDALRNNNKNEIFSIIEELPYHKSRVIYLMIYDEEIKRKEERLRKLEKLNDAA